MQVLTLGEKIRKKRKEMNMTLKDLAGERITPGQISLVESGKSNPSIDLLEYLAQKLHIGIDYFLESEEKQAEKVCDYYVTTSETLLKLGNIEKVQEITNNGIAFAEKYNLTYYKGRFNYIYANSKFLNKEYQEAQEYFLSANSAFLKTRTIDSAAESFIMLGKITYEMGYISTSLNYYIQADMILNEYNHIDELIKAKINYHIAISYYNLKRFDLAIKYAGIARDKIKLLENRKAYAESLIDLGMQFSEQGKINEALKYSKDAKKIFDEINTMREIANIEASIGIVFSKANDMTEAFEHLEKAYRLQCDYKDKSAVETMLILCENYITANKLDKAEKIVNEIIQFLNKDVDDNNFIIENRLKCYECLYKAFAKGKMISKAEQTLLEGLKYIEGAGTRKQIADFCLTIGKFYMSINKNEVGINYLNKVFDFYRELKVI